jgi:uncharacterized membrane protein YdbT with pleckstrin-like domain
MTSEISSNSPERTLKVFKESKWRPGFWIRTILTLSIWYWTVYIHNRIELTNRRVVQKRGTWLSRNETSILLANITDVSVNQSFLGRIFNYGDISISSAGSSGAEIAKFGISSAPQLRDLVFDLRDGRLDETQIAQVLEKKSKDV